MAPCVCTSSVILSRSETTSLLDQVQSRSVFCRLRVHDQVRRRDARDPKQVREPHQEEQLQFDQQTEGHQRRIYGHKKSPDYSGRIPAVILEEQTALVNLPKT